MNAIDDYQEWDDTRLGLGFTSYRGIVYYYSNAPFYVDGVYYHVNNAGPMCRRTMIELIEDGGGQTEMSFAPDPPSESELDTFVSTGLFDGRRIF